MRRFWRVPFLVFNAVLLAAAVVARSWVWATLLTAFIAFDVITARRKKAGKVTPTAFSAWLFWSAGAIYGGWFTYYLYLEEQGKPAAWFPPLMTGVATGAFIWNAATAWVIWQDERRAR